MSEKAENVICFKVQERIVSIHVVDGALKTTGGLP